MCQWILKHDGFFVGGSAGVNLVGAYLMAKKLGPGHTIATILCGTPPPFPYCFPSQCLTGMFLSANIIDGGDKYMSKIFNPAFLDEKKIVIGDAEELSFLAKAEALNELTVKNT
jgi:cysteine synthase A